MNKLIDTTKLPEVLKNLSTAQLEQVASQARLKMIEVCSKNGGHLASSLGAVEIAVALLSTFDSPKDKILWDVGHQAYAYKILTGRYDRFNTLRQMGGISGFPNIAESIHDQFTVGHASTSISQAVGMAKARDLLKDDHAVVAVIGDASLSGGLAFEAMNNASDLKSNLIVVLNDNEMSISRNVGAMSQYLTMVRTSDLYVDARNRIERAIKHIPKIGVPLFDAAKKFKDRTRKIVINLKVDVIFEELGFKYFGLIDGHNLPLLMSTLSHAREIKGPVLIHVSTKKGKGYPPAEKNPTLFHGIGPFDIETGTPVKKNGEVSYTQVFGETVAKLAEADPKIVAVTAAMIDGTGLEPFAKQHPDRFFDVGIAEEHAVTFAGAMARKGLRPVVAIYSTFLQRSYDEIFHDVCLQNLPVVFAIDRAGIVGEDGATHNGAFDMAYLRTIPNLTVMAPKDGEELREMLGWAVKQASPVAIRYPRGTVPQISNIECRISNFEVLILSIGSMYYPALEAAEMLKEKGINAKVINARFVKPLDRVLILAEAKKAERIVTVEEGTLCGGFGSAVMELLSQEGIVKPIKCLGLPDTFVEHGTRDQILEKYGLTGAGIGLSIIQ